MSPSLRAFIKSRCVCHAAARMPLAEFIHEFKASRPAGEHWTRQEIARQLQAAGFPVAVDPSAKVFYVGRLSLRGSWVSKAGKLVFGPDVRYLEVLCSEA